MSYKASLNSYHATPSDPTGTTSATAVMMGLGAAITPQTTGKLLIWVSGNMSNGASGGGGTAQIRYGTGTAPTNGAASTGTASGAAASSQNPLLALLTPGSATFSCAGIITGLTVGTAIWIDLSLLRISLGTSTIAAISISIIEI